MSAQTGQSGPCDSWLLCHKAGVCVKGIDTPEMKTKNKCEKDVARVAQKLTENLLKNGVAVPYDGGTKAKIDWCRRLPAHKK